MFPEPLHVRAPCRRGAVPANTRVTRPLGFEWRWHWCSYSGPGIVVTAVPLCVSLSWLSALSSYVPGVVKSVIPGPRGQVLWSSTSGEQWATWAVRSVPCDVGLPRGTQPGCEAPPGFPKER